MKFRFLAIFLILFLCGAVVAQEERIISYDTQIEVQKDRSIIVTELIQVYVTGDIIKRGITRNLPQSRYLNDKEVSVKYKILEVEKNGISEPYHTEDSGDLMLYMGEKDVFLSPGIYSYKIKYRVSGQIGFYDDYDEIYWNAIGNDVQFNVESASCRVLLPEDTKVIQESAYLGYTGEKSTDFTTERQGRAIIYRANRSLRPGEGFTVAIGFEKGVVSQPGFFDRFGSMVVLILGLLFLLPYYVYTWWKYGQDPPTPASYPIWTVPDGLSSASVNYIQKGHYQTKSFTASVIDLAIKGFLKIEEMEDSGFFSKKKYFDLVKLREIDQDMPPEEQQLFNKIFISSDRVSIDGKYNSTIETTYGMHKSSLSLQHSSFLRKGNNLKMLAVPVLVTIAVAALAIFLMTRNAYTAGINLTMMIGFIPIALIGLAFYGYLINKPTPEKLDLRSRIKGFKMYLELTEKDRLNLLNPPEMTPEHFEAVLPYAFALGVEHKWSEKFKTILERAQYRPQWHNSANTFYFASHFGNDFSKGVTGAATKPQSSGSGSGGGGFSGGGGGGGGVGGW